MRSVSVSEAELKAANKAGGDASFAVSAVNYEYVDSGLLGAFVVSEAAAAGKVGCSRENAFNYGPLSRF